MSEHKAKEHKKSKEKDLKETVVDMFINYATVPELLIDVIFCVYIISEKNIIAVIGVIALISQVLLYLNKNEKPWKFIFRILVGVVVFSSFFYYCYWELHSRLQILLIILIALSILIAFAFTEMQYLYYQLKNENAIDIKVDKRKPDATQVYNFIILVGTVLAILFAIKIGYVANDINDKNQPIDIDKDKISLMDEGDCYNVKLDDLAISQGGIKKAFLAYEDTKGIVYKDISPSSNNDMKIDKSLVDIKELDIYTESHPEAIEYLLDEHDAKVYDVVNFSLVILDYTNKWQLYYVIIMPEIVYPGVIHTVSATDPYDDPVSETIKVDYVSKQEEVIIDTSLINNQTLDILLDNFYAKNERLSEWIPNSKRIINRENSPAGGSITITDSSFTVDIPYTRLKTTSILENIDAIYKDFR